MRQRRRESQSFTKGRKKRVRMKGIQEYLEGKGIGCHFFKKSNLIEFELGLQNYGNIQGGNFTWELTVINGKYYIMENGLFTQAVFTMSYAVRNKLYQIINKQSNKNRFTKFSIVYIYIFLSLVSYNCRICLEIMVQHRHQGAPIIFQRGTVPPCAAPSSPAPKGMQQVKLIVNFQSAFCWTTWQTT